LLPMADAGSPSAGRHGAAETAPKRAGGAAARSKPANARGFVMPNGSVVPLASFKDHAVLGVGTFSRVKMVSYNREVYALKTMKKMKIDKLKQTQHIMNEKHIMTEMDHPFILKMISTWKDKSYLYILLELCQGGELFTRLLELKILDEDTTRFYAACIVLALGSLHKKNNIYRDLKPENILLDSQGYVKVVDFGFAKKIGQRTYTTCGTPEYVSPEMLEHNGHGKATDYWTLGIFIYECLCGSTPFAASNYLATYDAILAYARHGKLGWRGVRVSPEVQTLIRGLMEPDPNKRMGCLKGGVADIQKHTWFTGFPWDLLFDRKILAPWIPIIKNSTDTSHFDPDDVGDDSDVEEYEGDGSWFEAF